MAKSGFRYVQVTVVAGVELDFWWNKYQIPHSPAFDTNQTAVSLMVKYHL